MRFQGHFYLTSDIILMIVTWWWSNRFTISFFSLTNIFNIRKNERDKLKNHKLIVSKLFFRTRASLRAQEWRNTCSRTWDRPWTSDTRCESKSGRSSTAIVTEASAQRQATDTHWRWQFHTNRYKTTNTTRNNTIPNTKWSTCSHTKI